MNRTDLAALAAKCKTPLALQTALRSHFKTDAGRAAIAAAPLHYGSGLPQPMTPELATAALLEEARTFLPKPKARKR